MSFYPSAIWPEPPLQPLWFVFQGDRIVFWSAGAGAVLPNGRLEAHGLTPLRTHYLGRLQQDGECRDCFSAEIDPTHPLPDDMQKANLRHFYTLVDEATFWIAARAFQIVDWDRTHQFCSRCGTPTAYRPNEHVKVCPECRQSHYPRQAPAVIVAIERDGRLLLGHNRRHPKGLYSVLAGFVESGETLEACVVREVKEEVGIDVTDVRYFGSQPWPFPHSYMIAFTARYAGGDFVFEDEIETADWFSADNLPAIPPSLSISRQLIDDFVARHGGSKVEA